MTLVEILVVTAIVLVLWAFLMPTGTGTHHPYQTTCLSNLRQTSYSFQMWAEDHGSRFPWQVSTNDGGSLEFSSGATAFRHFAPLPPYRLQLRSFVCPTDSRKAALDFASFGNSNLSYFINLGAVSSSTNVILSGDRFITSDVPVRAQVLKLTTNSMAGWSGGHKTDTGFLGGLSFTDGHAEMSRGPLQDRLGSSDLSTNRFLLP